MCLVFESKPYSSQATQLIIEHTVGGTAWPGLPNASLLMSNLCSTVPRRVARDSVISAARSKVCPAQSCFLPLSFHSSQVLVWRLALSNPASFLLSFTGKPLPPVSLLRVSLHPSTPILENHIPQWQKSRRKSVSKRKWSTVMRKSSRERRKNYE